MFQYKWSIVAKTYKLFGLLTGYSLHTFLVMVCPHIKMGIGTQLYFQKKHIWFTTFTSSQFHLIIINISSNVLTLLLPKEKLMRYTYNLSLWRPCRPRDRAKIISRYCTLAWVLLMIILPWLFLKVKGFWFS